MNVKIINTTAAAAAKSITENSLAVATAVFYFSNSVSIFQVVPALTAAIVAAVLYSLV